MAKHHSKSINQTSLFSSNNGRIHLKKMIRRTSFHDYNLYKFNKNCVSRNETLSGVKFEYALHIRLPTRSF